MSPLLPDFTVHDFLKQGTDKLKEEIGHHLGVPPELLGIEVTGTNYLEIKEAISGEDGWLMTPVINSSNIMEIGFKENKCRVLFKGLKLFEYEPISEELWLQFLAAKSKGQFFSEHIRNKKEIKVKQVI